MTERITEIPEGWKMTTLGEVAEINAFTINKDYYFDEIEYIDVASVEERKLLQTQKLYLKSAPSRAKRIIRDDDILISTVRPNLKHFCFIKTSKPNLVASTGFAVVSAKRAYPYFLYNLLTTEKYTEYLTQIADAHTSTYPAFNSEVILNSKFLLPSLTEQRAIAAVLSSLDDKIELLREQNKTLEKVAQAIFKRWFIDFEFPDKNGNLYKSSGGKMIESELGDIPEGWRGEKITELFDFIKGVEPGADNYSKYKMSDNYIPFYRVQNISGNGNNNMPDIFIEKSLSYGKIFEEDDILVSLDGTIGKVFIGGSGSYSSGIRKVVVNKTEINQCLSYCFLKSDYFQNGLVLFSSGETTIKHAGKALENLKIAYSKDIFKKFSEITNPIFEKMVFNLKQIQTLSALRDSLLPRLMSGKIRVNGFGD